jgi:hypothetical protein
MATVTALPDRNPAPLIFDPNATPAVGQDANTSLVAENVRALSISGVTGVTVSVQVKVHPDAAWVEVASLTGAAAYYYPFAVDANMVQVVCPTTTGTTQVHAEIAAGWR